MKEQEVFMGDLPKMTENGTFVINGAERVIVSQLVRSPGVYFKRELDLSGKDVFQATIIPNRGAWLEFETDVKDDIIHVRIDRTRKIPVTVLLKAIGYGSSQEILDLLNHDPRIIKTLEKDHTDSYESGLLEIYKRLRPGEPLNVETARNLLESLFFDAKRYDFASVGRYKINKKLSLKQRILNRTLAANLKNPATGKIIAKKSAKIDDKLYKKIEELGIRQVLIMEKDQIHLVRNNRCEDESKENAKHLFKEDIVATVNYLLNLMDGIGVEDDIDHLGNRRLRGVGELLQNQFRIGLSRMERVIKERMTCLLYTSRCV